MVMLHLCKRKMYLRALRVFDWWEGSRKADLTERHYAFRLDLNAKQGGSHWDERYFMQIPESFRGEVVYQTMLANYVATSDFYKAEDIFRRMKTQFPVTAFACNQFLILYAQFDNKKMDDVWLLMKKENVEPTVFTYKIFIDIKGKSNGIPGLEI